MYSPSVSEEIIDYAKSKNVNLIVVGTKGLTGLAKFLLGSVARNVIAHTQCPVLAVR
jgi:nucleotide-binding universal stress UspA family protein